MAKIIKCPNCGASDPKKIEDNRYECNFCQSHFILEDKSGQTDILNALNQMHTRKPTSTLNPEAYKKAKKTLALGAGIMLFTVGIGVYFAFMGVNEVITEQVGQLQEDEYWGSASVNKFYVFEGNKGPVSWLLLNQSSKSLDSTKYTLQVFDPVKEKLLKNNFYISMTWKESFNFSNYLSEMVGYGNEVYFLSDQSGIAVYDMYTGKEKYNNEKFSQKFDQLKSGIISSKNVGYRNAFELQTNDGYKFYFLPLHDKLITQEQFDDYRSVRGKVTGFILAGESRQKLYFLQVEQDTLRSDISFSAHYLDEYLKNFQKGKQVDIAVPSDTGSVFFNVKSVYSDKNQIVFAYTGGMDKKSKAFLCNYSSDDLNQAKWKIELSTMKGFEKILAEDVYIQSRASEIELAIWYSNANKRAVGINLKTGKINWEYLY